ncbi:MAG TPA: hypothetical protein PKD64_05895 [Pirellulaceae bacterium]|nr:hypothetical protein [Pirellulaceae bacterium]HMO91711.1 hypothetical protein [Pirellulaceae bacterium]HMP68407.1 hypothetical protein [Pirellulaceae bacterium]
MVERIREVVSDDEIISGLSSGFLELWGVDLEQTEKFYVQQDFVLGAIPHSSVPMFTLNWQTNEPIDTETVMTGKLWSEVRGGAMTKETYNGIELFVTDETGPSLCFPDEYTASLSFESGNKAMIDRMSKETPPAQYDWIQNYFEIAGSFNFESHVDETESALREVFGGAPFANDKFFAAIRLIKSGYFRVEAKSKECLEVVLSANSEDDAETIAKTMKDTFTDVLVTLQELKEELERWGDESGGINLVVALSEVFGNATAQADGEHVKIQVQQEGGMVKVLKALANQMNYFFSMMSRR